LISEGQTKQAEAMMKWQPHYAGSVQHNSVRSIVQQAQVEAGHDQQ